MPIYCYSTILDDIKYIKEETFPMGEAPESIFNDAGIELKRDLGAEISGQGRPSLTGWPQVCCASGVHPKQAQQLRNLFDQHGCPTEVTKGGDPVYRSKEHRKKALKLRGMHDKSSFC